MSSFWVGYSENVIYAASHTRSSCLFACSPAVVAVVAVFSYLFTRSCCYMCLYLWTFWKIMPERMRRGIKRSEKAIEKRAIYSVQFIAIPFQRYHTGSLARSRLANLKISNWSLRFGLATIFVSLCYCRETERIKKPKKKLTNINTQLSLERKIIPHLDYKNRISSQVERSLSWKITTKCDWMLALELCWPNAKATS